LGRDKWEADDLDRAEQLRLLERETLRVRRQVDNLTGDLERQRMSLKRKIRA
jgi:hypothetical protein